MSRAPHSPASLLGRLLLVAAVVIAVGSALGVKRPSHRDSQRSAARRPNILLITLDTTRADHTSAYGYRRPTTPRLLQLAQEGIRFEVAYAPMAATTPAHATILTALEPRTHGVLRNGASLASSRVTLAEILEHRGYQTGAVVSAYPLHRSFGLARGFDTYDDDFAARDGQTRSPKPWLKTRWEGGVVEGDFDRPGDATEKLATGWLEKRGYLGGAGASGAPKQPFFLWVHFFDAHNPYTPPPEDAELLPPEGDAPDDLTRQIAGYDGDLHFADREMGALIDRLAEAGLLDDMLVVVAGDHGEGLMQHGWMFHGLFVYEEDVRVPLVLHWPRVLGAGRVVGAPVRLADVAPTILDLAGLDDRLPGAEGESLVPLWSRKGGEAAQRPIFLQRRLYDGPEFDGHPVVGEKVAIRLGRWKYIVAPEEGTSELYDLDGDPGETENVRDAHPEVVAQLEGALRGWQAAKPAAAPQKASSPEQARKLRALGYVQ